MEHTGHRNGEDGYILEEVLRESTSIPFLQMVGIFQDISTGHAHIHAHGTIWAFHKLLIFITRSTSQYTSILEILLVLQELTNNTKINRLRKFSGFKAAACEKRVCLKYLI